ncbi:unnamed protein product [Durusdinium trenchii]|uniref:EF-hand domain-containing protein n=1 Tax=Durusdinium trenchii TaxID=1381693 RepID=A0ABP0LTJ1_9DINO
MASPVSSIPRKLSAVLWDIDGTLVNSTALAWTSTNTVLQENGFKVVSEDEYKEATRLTTPARLAFHATGDQNHEVGLKLAKEFDDHYVGLVSKATVPLVPGLQEVLETLEKDGLILGALSNACGAYVRAVLKAHNWSESFKTQLGADEVSEAKPGAGGLLKCCEVLRTDPSSTCYVGDSPGDGKAARAAGMFCVGVRWGGQAEEGLRSNFDEVVSTADELIEEEEWRQSLAEAPALDANRLMSLATDLTLGIHNWFNKPGVDKAAFAGTQLWPKFVEAGNETSRHGRLKFPDFQKFILKIMRPPPSSNELLAFWREVDRDGTGEASAEHFDSAVYRLQVDTWPDLDEEGISRVIQILNLAAEKWHRAAGNWYKVFLACDEDGSGSMTFDEMLGVFRKGFPGLSISPQKLPEQELRGFWRALDAHRSGRVEVYDFMIFMRKYGAQYSMHKTPRGRRSEAIQDYGHPAERTDDELRHTAQVLDDSLTAYWNRCGVHVRSGDKWQRFLDEADLNKDGLVTFHEQGSQKTKWCCGFCGSLAPCVQPNSHGD